MSNGATLESRIKKFNARKCIRYNSYQITLSWYSINFEWFYVIEWFSLVFLIHLNPLIPFCFISLCLSPNNSSSNFMFDRKHKTCEAYYLLHAFYTRSLVLLPGSI
uniref:Uncharacterized protein n=1 Tax=Cacopsylla melanoneura TaxID=428564 RepID=A0A8D8LE08_9HEMI